MSLSLTERSQLLEVLRERWTRLAEEKRDDSD